MNKENVKENNERRPVVKCIADVNDLRALQYFYQIKIFSVSNMFIKFTNATSKQINTY